MSNTANQAPQKSTDAAKTGANKLSALCFVLSNLLFSYQLFLMLGELLFGPVDMYRIPVLTNSLIPLALVVVCILISVSQHAETYNIKAAVAMFVVAVVCYLIPSVMYSVIDQMNLDFNFMRWLTLITNTARYFCLAFGYVNMFIEPGKKLKTYVFLSLLFPCMIGVALLIAIPALGISLLVLCAAFLIIMNISAKITALSIKQKDMIKGAAIGGIIAGDAGAVVGAMIAKDRHENGQKK